MLPFALFAYGQVRVSAEVAGAFLNLEPLVGAVAGAVVFRNPVGAEQVLGGAAILAGIGLSSLPLLAVRRRPVAQSSRAGALRVPCPGYVPMPWLRPGALPGPAPWPGGPRRALLLSAGRSGPARGRDAPGRAPARPPACRSSRWTNGPGPTAAAA